MRSVLRHDRKRPTSPFRGHPRVPADNRGFIFESSSAGIIGVDVKGRIRSWNAGARRIFGYGRKELLRCPISRLLPPENKHGMSRLISRILNQSWLEYRETSCMKKGAHRIDVGFTGLPEETLSPDRHGVLLLIHDITARKEMERAIQEKITRSENAQHLARLGSWEWNVSTDSLVWSEEFRHRVGARNRSAVRGADERQGRSGTPPRRG